MLHRKKFCSVFKSEEFCRSGNKQIDAEQNWEISDSESTCSSENEDFREIGRKRPFAEVDNCDSDEETCNRSMSFSNFFGGMSINKRLNTQQFPKARNNPLPIILSQKIYNVSPRSEGDTFIESDQAILKSLSKFTNSSQKCKLLSFAGKENDSMNVENESHKLFKFGDDNRNLDEISWSSSDSEAVITTPNNSQIIATQSVLSQQSTGPSELDLLIATIEKEFGKKSQSNKSVIKSKMRRGRKGGYLEELQNTLNSIKSDRKYLHHDKKIGLQSGVKLRVIEIKCSFGVYMASMEPLENNSDEKEIFFVIFDAEMANKAKVGSILEAFFDENVKPYILDKHLQGKIIYVQPNKLLM